MLILTRQIGENLRIGTEVSVTVLGVKGNQIRLGIDAPKSVAVHREEIFQRIAKENQAPPPPRCAWYPKRRGDGRAEPDLLGEGLGFGGKACTFRVHAF